ncbi:MAG: methyltransferase domain-containing protein [Lachnospiraceae bacterium]|nr:methyltransferase domain-containing protein [Lachnospiraceae bacterium]
MDKKELLFYDAYEAFYGMAKKSNAFQKFCKDAFGEDFSQDGFSNIEQINMILQYIPQKDNVRILDIGCGNGKMLGYLQEKTEAYICGFDYSEEAIETARFLFPKNSEFREGVIGEIDYPEENFDVIISMDTMYFAKDMTAFVNQVKKWLKERGVFFVGYQEGDVIPKTENMHTTMLSKALVMNGMKYEAIDITEQTYELLKKKRISAIAHQNEFEAEGYRDWFDMLIGQTECATETFEQFKEKMARYIYVIRK